MQLIEVKVRYSKETENGKKKETEKYLVDAMTFTEAEARIIEGMDALCLEDFSVEAVRQSGYEDECFTHCDTDNYYKVKVIYTIVDEETEKPTRIRVYYLVQADSIASAVRYAQQMIKDSVYDTRITEVTETDIVDVIMEGH